MLVDLALTLRGFTAGAPAWLMAPSMVLTGRAINGINQFIERVRVAVKQRINQFVLGGVVVIKVNWADAEFGGNQGGRGIAFAKLVEQFKRDIRKR